MHDLVIRGADVHDGLGGVPRIADVAVDQGRITTIGHVADKGHQEVAARGLTLMPGIVDLHTHFDAQVTWDRTLSPSPALGVTTAVLGNCGFGIAPCPAPLRETMIKNLSVVEGMDLNALRTGIQWNFESFSEYLQQLRRTGPYLNTAVFAGHSVLRTAVMGDAGSEQALSICTPTLTPRSPGTAPSRRHPHWVSPPRYWATAALVLRPAPHRCARP